MNKYLVFNEVLNKIGAAALQNDNTEMHMWNNLLDDLVDAAQDDTTVEWVLGLCVECGNYYPVRLDEIEEYTDDCNGWWCPDCEADFEAFLEELQEVDPQVDEHEAWRRLDAEAHRYYYDPDDDDCYEPAPPEAASMMMCDITGVCSGPNCEKYHECNSICKG